MTQWTSEFLQWWHNTVATCICVAHIGHWSYRTKSRPIRIRYALPELNADGKMRDFITYLQFHAWFVSADLWLQNLSSSCSISVDLLSTEKYWYWFLEHLFSGANFVNDHLKHHNPLVIHSKNFVYLRNDKERALTRPLCGYSFILKLVIHPKTSFFWKRNAIDEVGTMLLNTTKKC